MISVSIKNDYTLWLFFREWWELAEIEYELEVWENEGGHP